MRKVVLTFAYYIFQISAKPFVEEGVIDSGATFHCHNVTVVDDDVVEGTEVVQVSLVDVSNVATVLLNPNHTTITVEDDDSKDTTLHTCQPSRIFIYCPAVPQTQVNVPHSDNSREPCVHIYTRGKGRVFSLLLPSARTFALSTASAALQFQCLDPAP